MSYYQRRSVLVKTNDPETSKRWHDLLGQLKEKNEDMSPVNEMLVEAEKNNGVMEFEFEYYSAEAFNEFEALLNEARSSDKNQNGIIVKLDSDYGSYISAYGAVKSKEIVPMEERWTTGTFASVIIDIDTEQLAKWIGCEDDDDMEEFLCEYEENLIELFDVSEYEGIELELESYEEDGSKSVFQLGLGFDFFRHGTIDELTNDFNAIKRMKDKIVSMDGSLTLGQSEILLLKDKGECNWIAEQGFIELKLESTTNNLGEFVTTCFELS